MIKIVNFFQHFTTFHRLAHPNLVLVITIASHLPPVLIVSPRFLKSFTDSMRTQCCRMAAIGSPVAHYFAGTFLTISKVTAGWTPLVHLRPSLTQPSLASTHCLNPAVGESWSKSRQQSNLRTRSTTGDQSDDVCCRGQHCFYITARNYCGLSV